MDLGTDNSSTAVSDNQTSAGPATNANETGTTGGQAQGAAPTDDLFRGVDPNRLPPEVKQHYDSMLRDYRDKTGKLSETIKSEVAKSTESFKSKAELYDQIAQQEEFVKQWNDYVQQKQQSGQSVTEGDPILNKLQQQVQEMNQKIQLTELSQVTDAFADAVDEKGAKIHPDFDQLNSITIGQMQNGGKSEDFSFLRACIELAPGRSPGEKLANGYKTAKAAVDAIFESGRKAGLGRLQTKVLNGSLPPSNSGVDTISITEKRPKNAREAIEMAKRGQMVSRD